MQRNFVVVCAPILARISGGTERLTALLREQEERSRWQGLRGGGCHALREGAAAESSVVSDVNLGAEVMYVTHKRMRGTNVSRIDW